MKPWVEVCSKSARTLVSAVGSFVLWTFWLALAVLLFLQLYVVTANELAIPEPALRRLEARLEEFGVKATFGRTSFDPAGRILIENLQLTLPAFAEPIVTCKSAYIRLSPGMLAMGFVEPRELQLNEVTAFVPSMLSTTGQPEAIVRNLSANLTIAPRSITFNELSAIVADVPVSAHGALMLTRGAERPPETERLADVVARQFAAMCRQALALREQIAQFEDPALHLEFAPSESGAATIQVLALARVARLTKPLAFEATDLRVTTRLLLFGDTPSSEIDFSARAVKIPGKAAVTGLQARLTGRLRLAAGTVDIREIDATVDSVLASEVDVRAISARIFPRPLPKLETQLVANLLGTPLMLNAEADLAERSAVARFEGAISPLVPDVLGRRLGVNVKKYADYDSLTVNRGEVHFGANWAFEKLTARIRVPRIVAYNVTLEDGRAEIDLQPHRLFSPDAFVRVGKNSYAHGSYEHEFATNRYRFLLEGRLRPLEISEWFREWWTEFFSQLEFPRTPPVANVDVRGSWRDGHQSNIFVFAEAPKATIRGTELDRVRTRLFIRPAFFDGLEMLALRGKGNAHGRFTYTADPETNVWHTLDLGFDSTFDLSLAAQLLGPAGAKTLEPFRLAQPPQVKVRGQFAGPEAPGGVTEKLRIEARTAGDFRYYDFPLQDVAFTATIDRDDIVLDNVEALFAGGVATGHARVSGSGAQRRLGFDFALKDASLGKVAAGLAEFFSARKGEAPAAPGKFVQEKANVHLDFAASAEGRYDDPLSYRGDGNAVLRGAEIGEVPLLGTLSELLKFTALRFTEARANFKIDNNKLVFPQVTLRGSNSSIDAHGTYAMDKRALEFNAKLFPFQESENLIKTVVGAVLTPLSNAFEVKLTGTFEKPQWAFVMGPSNFLRSLNSDSKAKAEPPADEKDPKTPVPPDPASTSGGDAKD